MTDSLVGFMLQLLYLFTHMTLSNLLDIMLVAIVFFVIFQGLYQTRALQLLRGVIIIAILGATLLVLLPFDTLNWLVTISLLAGVIALPLLFQDELRRALTGLGKLQRRRGYGTNFESFKKTIIEAVESLSKGQVGALIVLEGETPLDDIIKTGILLQAEIVSKELLETIFQNKTPLHDGAVILRGDRLMAASCILPVQTESTGAQHMGTRHRAALGLSSKVTDALILIVSEETGRISVAWKGRIYKDLDIKKLNYWLEHFRSQFTGDRKLRWEWLRGGDWRTTVSHLIVAIGLAIIAWLSVIFQTNPPGQLTIQGVPLVVTGPANGLILLDDLPDTVSVQVQASQNRIDTLDVSSVRAELPLSDLPAGVHNVPVSLDLADRYTEILSISPSNINVTLESELNKVISPTVSFLNKGNLPAGYMVKQVSLSPETITVIGLQSRVEDIEEAVIEINLDGQRVDFQDTFPVSIKDSYGVKIKDIRIVPESILVTVDIERTYFTREIPVQATIEKSGLDRDYEVSSVRVDPSKVMLTGTQTALDAAGDFLVTTPISLSNVYSGLTIDVPIVIPENVTVLDDEGNNISGVNVEVIVKPITDYLVLEARINLTGIPEGFSARISPNRASILFIGPRPLLNEIFIDPSLVNLSVNLEGLKTGIFTLPVQVQAPDEVQTQLFPSEIEVIIEEIQEGS